MLELQLNIQAMAKELAKHSEKTIYDALVYGQSFQMVDLFKIPETCQNHVNGMFSPMAKKKQESYSHPIEVKTIKMADMVRARKLVNDE